MHSSSSIALGYLESLGFPDRSFQEGGIMHIKKILRTLVATEMIPILHLILGTIQLRNFMTLISRQLCCVAASKSLALAVVMA